MNGHEVQLWGGPRDGEVHQIVEDLRVLRFAQPDPNFYRILATEIPEPTAMEITYCNYERTRHFQSGKRIYRYLP